VEFYYIFISDNKSLNINKNEFHGTKTVDFVENRFSDTKSKEHRLEDIVVCEMNSQENVSKDAVCLTDVLKYECNKEGDDISRHVQQSKYLIFIYYSFNLKVFYFI